MVDGSIRREAADTTPSDLDDPPDSADPPMTSCTECRENFAVRDGKCDYCASVETPKELTREEAKAKRLADNQRAWEASERKGWL